MNYLAYVFILFIIYSIIGYICEMTYAAFKNQKIVNRGFLCGPYLPIYGLGAVFVLYLLLRYESDPIVVFVFAIIICSSLEYFTSFLLEKIFHNMWWDYYDYKYNLNGRICLFNSLLFGIASLVVIYLAQPLIDGLLGMLSVKFLNILAIIIFIIFIIDVVYSIIVAFNLRNRLIIVEELKREKLSKIPRMFEKILKQRVAKFRIYPTRLLKAFPRLFKDNIKEFTLMKKFKNNKNSKKW